MGRSSVFSRTFAPQVFLSHSLADKPVVRTLAKHLWAADMKVWVDQQVPALVGLVACVEPGLERIEDALPTVFHGDAQADGHPSTTGAAR